MYSILTGLVLKQGDNSCILKSFGTTLCSIEKLMICKMGLLRIEAASLTNLTGILSVPVLLVGFDLYNSL